MRIRIGMPAYGGIQPLTVQSLIITHYGLTLMGHEVELDMMGGCSILPKARNEIVQRFWDAGEDILFFIDSDMQWRAMDAVKLIRSEHEMTCCNYRVKSMSEDRQVVHLLPAPDHRPIVQDGWVQADGAGTGFLCIKRSAIERMRGAYPQYLYRDQNGYEHCALFDHSLEDGAYYGEDYTFVKRWTDIGGEVWCWPNAYLGHIGSHCWTFNFHKWLLEQPGGSEDSDRYVSPGIHGFMADTELQWLYDRAKRMRSIVEVGSWEGRSTHALASGCPGEVVCVDTFDGSRTDATGTLAQGRDVFERFKSNTAGLPNVRALRATSMDAAQQIHAVDMVFIDAGHEYGEVRADIEAWKHKAGRLVCGHDYHPFKWPGVVRAVDEAFGGAVKTYETIWYVEKAAA